MTPSVAVVEFSPSGGLFHFALQMSEALAEAGHQVTLVTGSDPELQPRVSGVHVAPILPTWHPGATRPGWRRKLRRLARLLRYLEAWRRVALYLRRTRPDVVQWAELRFPLDGAMVAWLASRRGAPAMVDVVHEPRPVDQRRGEGALHRRAPLLRLALSAAYRRVDAVFVLGEQTATAMRRTWPGVRRVVVIPHGDEGIFVGARQGPLVPAGDCPPRVVFFGTWTRYKGIDLLLEAFVVVRQHVPEAELVLAGAAANDVDVGEIVAQAAAVGGVDVRPGYVPTEGVAELMGTCRVVVVPYRVASQSGVVHVAQTFGRPVVATDVGDLAAVVRDGDTGLLVERDDAAALATALVRLLRDPGEATRMGANGRRRLEAEGSWDRVAAQVSPVYSELAAARRSNGGPAGRTRSHLSGDGAGPT